jgi:hypothetical protein
MTAVCRLLFVVKIAEAMWVPRRQLLCGRP